ncbi:MAG TPA: sulfotransferase [Actinomycetota bacterium]|nr:sulfotransferase [Actinomycetota bacterium]
MAERGRAKIRAATMAATNILPVARRDPVRAAFRPLNPYEYAVGLEPPPAAAGRETGPPNFIGVGVQKAGTSWWFAQLTRQSDIHNERGYRKERHFFDRFLYRSMTSADIEAYARWFPRPSGMLAGEWTPEYMHFFWIPALIPRAAPDAKILVLLRDPIERYRSGLAHKRRDGTLVPKYTWGDEAFHRGLYGAQLRRLREFVPRDQILVQQYERCCIDPVGELRRTLAFIGAESSNLIGPFDRGVHVTVAPKPDLPPQVRDALVDGYRDDLRLLLELHPDLDLSLWPNVGNL